MTIGSELAKYIGNEMIKTGGKELAKAGAKSALSSLVPSVATKAGTEMANKSVLNSLVPTATRKLASGIELGTDMIPMFRGQTNTLDKLDYNKGLSPNSNGFFMTPNKSATDSWAGKGVVSVDADPNDIMTLDELRSLKKSAEKYFRDPKYQMELYNTNPTQAEIYDALESGDSYQELSRLTKKPFIERDGGQGTELGEVVFFPDTKPELTSRYNADLASGKNQWLAPTEDVVASETSFPAGTKIKFDKDLNIKDIEKPSRGRGWYADNETNPHISQVVKQNGLDKYLGEPKINQPLAEEPGITIYHGTPNKFEDFDESLPSVWFTNNKDTIRDTGLSWDGKGDLNVMERILPNNLKLADWDTADRLTQQQMIDRGYDGVIYDEGDGSDIYYEIFNPNKTLKKIPKVQQSKIELSPQQQEFFKDSVVRDKRGNLLKLYHGTDSDFSEFGDVKTEPGYWFTEDKSYALSHGKNLKTVNLNMVKPLDMTTVDGDNKMLEYAKDCFGEGNFSESDILSNKFRDYLVKLGYDGMIFDHSGKNTYIAFSPEQIKMLDK